MLALALTALLTASPAKPLDGTWDGRLGDAASGAGWQPIRVPGNLSFQGIHYDGVFWLRTHFEVADSSQDWALRLPMTANAYEVFVNGEFVGRNGRIGAAGELEEKSLRERVFRVKQSVLRTGANELSLRVRTFEGNGGMMAPGVLVGPEDEVRGLQERHQALVAMLVALFAFAAFFHVVLFVGHRRERHHLSFAFLSSSLASITAGINTLGYLLTDSDNFNAWLVFVPILVMPFAAILFFSDFFSRRAVLMKRTTAGLALAGIAVLVTATLHHPLYPFFENVVLPVSVLALVGALITSTLWTLQGLRARQLGAGAVLTGIAVYALTGVLELAWTFDLVDFHLDSNLGFAFFIGAMVVAIGRRFAWLHQQVEKGERDALTGCLTRHGFRARYAAIERSPSMSCIMFDIDHFKRVNDTHGHQVGDRVLERASEAMRGVLRAADLFVRWGGEEFLVVLPSCDLEAATDVARRMRIALRGDPVEGVSVSASFGVAQKSEGEGFDEWLERADKALYEAKNAGRDRVQTAA